MAKKYKFVRMPEEVYKQYYGIKCKMEGDIQKVAGKRIPLTMTKVFRAISPEMNRNYIEVDIHKLVELAKEKKK